MHDMRPYYFLTKSADLTELHSESYALAHSALCQVFVPNALLC